MRALKLLCYVNWTNREDKKTKAHIPRLFSFTGFGWVSV